MYKPKSKYEPKKGASTTSSEIDAQISEFLKAGNVIEVVDNTVDKKPTSFPAFKSNREIV